jgi:hypothetical protein
MISVASGVEGTGATAIRQAERQSPRSIWCAIRQAPWRDLAAWAEAEKHEVAGNHVRFDAKSDLVLDEGWKKSLSPLRQSAIDLGTPISRQTMPKTGAVR